MRTVEPLGEPGADPLGLPDMALMLTDALVVFDHLKHTVTVLVNADAGPTDAARARAAADDRRGPRRAATGRCRRSSAAGPPRAAPAFESNMPRAQLRRRWSSGSCDYIHAGDAFQVVPSQRWSARVPVEAFSIYRGLRAVNP